MEALIHGNRLMKAAISTADGLRDLWASLAVKDMLRKYGIYAEVAPSYPENTAILNQQLLEEEGIPLPTTELLNEHHQPQKRTKKQKAPREGRRGQENNPKDQPQKDSRATSCG